jgi:hypothetical protein
MWGDQEVTLPNTSRRARDAEMKKPRWGDRGFARTDDPDRGNPKGRNDRPTTERRERGYDSAENCDRLSHAVNRWELTHVRVARV